MDQKLRARFSRRRARIDMETKSRGYERVATWALLLTAQVILVPGAVDWVVPQGFEFVRMPIVVVSGILFVVGAGLTLFSLAAWPTLGWKHRLCTFLSIGVLAGIARFIYLLSAKMQGFKDF